MTYPALELLLQAYLTLDWPDDYVDAWAAVDDFVANEPIAGQISGEVTELLKSNPCDDELRRLVVGELGSGYLPETDGWSMREWLDTLRQRVTEALGG
ncbi:contact-dependent growth inhibition system immunity protein [Actinopolymorpha sp. B9G3]|uniref:contact-dependent growth inhibition system immunity protein n=1 Tax=Actinopolymorpha sp. B9G3 TaxID=3158970 RepID=UPI0032D8DB54